jgi:hypothetical protein
MDFGKAYICGPEYGGITVAGGTQGRGHGFVSWHARPTGLPFGTHTDRRHR